MFIILLIALIICATAPPASEVLLVQSDTSGATTIISPSGLGVAVERRHTSHVPNYLGDGAQWIWNNVPNPADAWPVGYTNTFQSIFQVTACPYQGKLNITADNIFEVWLNGVEIGNGDDWFKIYTFYVNFAHGTNNMTIKVINQDDNSPESLVFTLVKETTTGTCLNPSHTQYNSVSCLCQCKSVTSCPAPYQWSGYPVCGCICP